MFDFLFSFMIIVFTIILNFFYFFHLCPFFGGRAGRGGARSSVPLHSLFIYSVFVLAL